jgi:hypothetical protein
MARAGSGKRKARNLLIDFIGGVSSWGFWVGGLAFIATTGYLLWAILSQSMVRAMSQVETVGLATSNLTYASQILYYSGLVAVISAAVRYYDDEASGYLLLLFGAALRWGVPTLVAQSFPSDVGDAAAWTVYLLKQFAFIGAVALIAAVPPLLYDFYFKITATGAPKKSRGALTIAKPEDAPPPTSRFQIHCWNMPYCRDYLRKFCKPTEQGKSCWRIKSGCYCDEEMILRVMEKSSTSSKGWGGFDQRFSEAAGGKTKEMTPAQKRERCRKCFIYAEHQKMKYRVLSPLSFVAALALLYMYNKPLMMAMDKGLSLTDQVASHITFKTSIPGTAGTEWSNNPAFNGMAEWLLLICIGLTLVGYILRALEYMIFDLQV